MDTRRFDDLIRSLSFPASRRGILAVLSGALFLSIPLVSSIDETEAKRKKRRKKRRKKGGSSPSPTSPPSTPPPPTTCSPTCSGVTCGEADGCGGTCGCAAPAVCDAAGSRCCNPEGTTCTSFEGCCSQTCDSLVGGGTCAPCRGRTCSATRPCCGGLSCVERVLRRLPRSGHVLHVQLAMLLQQLHQRRLLVGHGRSVRPRRRLPLLLPQPQLHQRVRWRYVHGVSHRAGSQEVSLGGN